MMIHLTPQDQTAAEGEHVTLPCRVSDRRGVLQWTRDDFGLGSDRRLDGFSRYAMTGSDDEGKDESAHLFFCCKKHDEFPQAFRYPCGVALG